MTTTDINTSTTGTTANEAPPETPRPMPMREEASRHNQRGPVARFFRSLFSHLLFAGVTVAGVLGYLYHAPILRDVGDTVCADKVLGQWMSAPPATVVASRSTVASPPAAPPSPTPAASAGQSEAAAKSAPATVTLKTSAKSASEGHSQSPAAEPPASASAAPANATATSTTAPSASPAAKPAATAAADTASTGVVSPAAPPVARSAAQSSSQAAQPEHSAPATVAVAPDTKPAAIANAGPSTSPGAAAGTPPATEPAAPSRETIATPAPEAASGAETSASQQSTAALPGGERATTSPPHIAATTPTAPEVAAPSDSRVQMLREWASAREAFSKGKPEAVTAYLDLAKRFPDVPELTGELGNIYFQQGKMTEAAAQYYETAQRLIRLGQPGPAACLIDVMRYLDADKAKALEAQTNVPCPVQRSQRN